MAHSITIQLSSIYPALLMYRATVEVIVNVQPRLHRRRLYRKETPAAITLGQEIERGENKGPEPFQRLTESKRTALHRAIENYARLRSPIPPHYYRAFHVQKRFLVALAVWV
ncbi:uncharacterized protein SPSK_02847 [Sporothrix schenckii 1099-18]|uniref:Uncharacterized protein n=1 Tax=Sporothrix schenckii 1099-18 TaxID=1397361 RepID=A0A0F2MB77_SPOSC|nr:uncharacterized protein SPSK_02847 [Sporothrix schenckii 1099-18]KJR86344.1 hypothetical protein SPSK_02847 [Sporothrix schenckii 1099-18]